MRIEHNAENNTITVGKATFRRFANYKSRKVWAQIVCRENNITYPHGHPKDENKALSDILGCSAVQMYKHFCGLQMKVFVAPYYDVLKHVSFSRGRIPAEALWRVSKHYSVLKPVLDDKLFHLLPIVAATGKSPQQLKAEMKNKWKAVSANSLHRNKALYHCIKAEANCVEAMAKLLPIPTTVLQNHSRGGVPVMEYLAHNFKGQWCHPLSRESTLYHDTVRMARQLDEEVSPKWTPRRVQQEHYRMSREITARRYSPEPFKSCVGLPAEVEEGEYKATLLNSAQLVAQEGEAMGHCVAGYADDVRQGSYLVYSITKGGQRSSTLGIRVHNTVISSESDPDLNRTSTSYAFNQHHGKFNRRVVDETEQRLVYTVIEYLNKSQLDNTQQTL